MVLSHRRGSYPTRAPPPPAATRSLLAADDATAVSSPILVTVDDSSRFVNLSTRAPAGAGSQTIILGFAIDTPPGISRHLIIRGIGPALSAYGVASPLPDPRITIYNANGQALDDNSAWNLSTLNAAQFTNVGAFLLAPGSKDAALAFTVAQPGSYTVHLTSTGNHTGVALVELYENDNVAHRLANLSTRAFVGTGADVVIPGFVVSGPASKRLLVRAVGPTLASYGVGGTLADPQIKLMDANGVVLATNDNWSANATAKADLTAAFATTGAFPLPDESFDAALIATVAPGRYTAIASGVNGSTGVALVEIYELP